MERLDQFKQRLDKFVSDRDWHKFHTPSNLSKSISIEANELLECFQWSDTDYDIEAVKEELADVMNYCIQLSMVLGVDIIDILMDTGLSIIDICITNDVRIDRNNEQWINIILKK